MRQSDGGVPALPDDAQNVLVLAPPDVVHSRATYRRWVAVEEGVDTRVLVLAYLRPPQTYYERWVAVGAAPTAFAVVDARDERGGDVDAPAEVVSQAPNDLTRLGIHVNETLSSWTDADEVRFVHDSLTALLQYVDVETAYRFLHVLTSRIDTLDARAWYGMHPSRHDDRTVSVFKQLVDTVVTYDSDAETWSLATR